MEKQEKIFVDGMRFELPNEIMKEKTPWIKGRISCKVPDLITFLQKHQNNSGWLNIDLKKSEKTGKLYMELNTWKPVIRKEEDHTAVDPVTGIDLNDPNSPF